MVEKVNHFAHDFGIVTFIRVVVFGLIWIGMQYEPSGLAFLNRVRNKSSK